MRFVIIGGDAAGMSAASRAKRIQSDMDVTVLEMSQDVSYSACGMPYNIAEPEREMNDLVVRRAEVFRSKQGIDLRTGSLAEKINPGEKNVRVRTSSGETYLLPYDKLMIATGASPVIPNYPGIDSESVMVLKSLAHGRDIKHFLKKQSVKKVVIIGMGYIAIEMAEAFRSRGIAVSMVKPRPLLLPWMAPELSEIVREELQRNQVELFPGHSVERIETGKGNPVVVCTDLEISGDMVLVAVGVRPNSEIARDAGLTIGVGDAISVDNRLRTSDTDIFAAGDCADAPHIVTGEKTWIPLALRANRAGWAVADNVCGKDVALPGIAGTAVFKAFDLEVARTGLNEKESVRSGFDPVSVTIKTRSRAHAHPGAVPIRVHMVGDKKSGKLLGVQMVGAEGVAHRINAAATALFAKMTVEAFLQTDMAYAPPFGPVWDPLLTAANQLMKKL